MNIFRSRKFRDSRRAPEDPMIDHEVTEDVVDGDGNIVTYVRQKVVPRSLLSNNLPEFRGYELDDLLKAGVELKPVQVNLTDTDILVSSQNQQSSIDAAISKLQSLPSLSSNSPSPVEEPSN